jgi:hypothetical protein
MQSYETSNNNRHHRWVPSTEADLIYVGLIKNPAGDIKPEKLFYHTSSPDSWVSWKLVQKYRFKIHPILHEAPAKNSWVVDVDFLPTHYIEIDLQDADRGITEFTKVSFYIDPSMAGLGLYLGRRFMVGHGIGLYVMGQTAVDVPKGKSSDYDSSGGMSHDKHVTLWVSRDYDIQGADSLSWWN